MMLDPTPAKAKSRHPLWGTWTKGLVVACLLSSAAMLTQPSPAHARNGMNGFMAGAILGGAMRGFGPPQATRGYRTGRTTTRSGRYTRSRSKGKQVEEAKKEEILRTETATSTAAAGSGGAAAATTTTAASANANSGPSAGAGTASATEGRGNGSRSSRRNGRRGGGLETTSGGLE